jgi:N utilization substance protein A
VTIGRTEGVLPSNEQVRGEHYTPNSRMKFFIVEVRDSQKGPQIFLSRTHPGLVKKLFELEVPEIRDGIVSIDSLAREAGSRTKMAVSSSDESVDPVGACVGNRGNRVQAVVDELMDEKIDIIPWTDDTVSNISSALAPAQVEKIIFNEGENRSVAVVPDFQLSLAIGKEGQNVRLAARLCGAKIDIKSHSQYHSNAEDLMDIPDAALDEEGYYNPEDFLTDDAEDGAKAPEIEEETIEEYLSPEDYAKADGETSANSGSEIKEEEE